MPDAVVIGEAVFDLFAHPPGNPMSVSGLLRIEPGGAPANAAVALARLGVSVGFVGVVGRDPFGDMWKDILAGEGVDTKHFRQTDALPTTLAVVNSTGPTEQQFIIYRGADTQLKPEDIDPAYLSTARVLLFGSVTLTAASRDAAMKAVTLARQYGTSVCYDTNLREQLWPSLDAARTAILEGLRGVDVCKLNEQELLLLAGTSDPEPGTERILQRGPSTCIVTLGSRGSYFNNGNSKGHIPSFEVTAVDTTGCGDAFFAGLICGLLEDAPPIRSADEVTLRRSIKLANAAGAMVATQIGAVTALPRRDELAAFLRLHA